MEQTIKTDVVIIGAGPTGPSLATQLIRYGIDFVVVEKNEGVTPFSKAIGVQARTLEIYEQLGLTQKAVEHGAIAGKARLVVGGEIRAEVDLSNMGQGRPDNYIGYASTEVSLNALGSYRNNFLGYKR